MKSVNLYDIIPTRDIDLEKLFLGQRFFNPTYIKKGVKLNDIKYNDFSGRNSFHIEYVAPYDCYYVPNGNCKEHAKWLNWGYSKLEPILCEFWDTREEYENSEGTIKKKNIPPPSYTPIIDKEEEQDTFLRDACYTYLMRDESTGYYKIGMSKNPEYRERTLQSEKPTIKLLAKKMHYSREKARSYESYLHQKYKYVRIRGEWFALSEKQVLEVKSLL